MGSVYYAANIFYFNGYMRAKFSGSRVMLFVGGEPEPYLSNPKESDRMLEAIPA